MLQRDHASGYNARTVRLSMNRALDQSLDAEERDNFHTHLDNTPRDAQLWQHMRQVDRLMHTAQTVQAPATFSARVMAAIAASREMVRLDGESARNFQTSISVAIALMVAVCAAIPVLGGILVLFVALIGSGAFVPLAQQLHQQWLALQTTLLGLSNTLATSPAARVVALLAVSVAAGCGYLMRWITNRTPDVTYQIPVSFASSSSIPSM